MSGVHADMQRACAFEHAAAPAGAPNPRLYVPVTVIRQFSESKC